MSGATVTRDQPRLDARQRLGLGVLLLCGVVVVGVFFGRSTIPYELHGEVTAVLWTPEVASKVRTLVFASGEHADVDASLGVLVDDAIRVSDGPVLVSKGRWSTSLEVDGSTYRLWPAAEVAFAVVGFGLLAGGGIWMGRRSGGSARRMQRSSSG